MSSLQAAQKLSTSILRSHDLASAHEKLAAGNALAAQGDVPGAKAAFKAGIMHAKTAAKGGESAEEAMAALKTAFRSASALTGAKTARAAAAPAPAAPAAPAGAPAAAPAAPAAAAAAALAAAAAVPKLPGMGAVLPGLRRAAAQCVARAQAATRGGRHPEAEAILHKLCLPPAEALELKALSAEASEVTAYVGAGAQWALAHALRGHALACNAESAHHATAMTRSRREVVRRGHSEQKQGAEASLSSAAERQLALESYAAALALDGGCFDAHAGAGVLLAAAALAQGRGKGASRKSAARAAELEQAIAHLRAATALPQGRTWYGGFLCLGDALSEQAAAGAQKGGGDKAAEAAAAEAARAAYGKAAVSAQIAARREAASAAAGGGESAPTTGFWHAAAECSAAAALLLLLLLQPKGGSGGGEEGEEEEEEEDGGAQEATLAQCATALSLAEAALGGSMVTAGLHFGAVSAAAAALLGARLAVLRVQLAARPGSLAAALRDRAVALEPKAARGANLKKATEAAKGGGGDDALLLISERRHLLPNPPEA